MNAWTALWGNRVLVNGLIGWAAAQVLKTGIYAAINRRLDIHRLFGDGGMLYFYIKKDDLSAKRFDKTHFSVQCY